MVRNSARFKAPREKDGRKFHGKGKVTKHTTVARWPCAHSSGVPGAGRAVAGCDVAKRGGARWGRVRFGGAWRCAARCDGETRCRVEM